MSFAGGSSQDNRACGFQVDVRFSNGLVFGKRNIVARVNFGKAVVGFLGRNPRLLRCKIENVGTTDYRAQHKGFFLGFCPLQSALGVVCPKINSLAQPVVIVCARIQFLFSQENFHGKRTLATVIAD